MLVTYSVIISAFDTLSRIEFNNTTNMFKLMWDGDNSLYEVHKFGNCGFLKKNDNNEIIARIQISQEQFKELQSKIESFIKNYPHLYYIVTI
jgi:hypothetical protein